MAHVFLIHLVYEVFKVSHVFREGNHCADKLAL